MPCYSKRYLKESPTVQLERIPRNVNRKKYFAMISIKTGCAEKNRPESDVSITQCIELVGSSFSTRLDKI